MILWCAWCQTCIGEVAPYDQFEMSHGICAQCELQATGDDSLAVASVQPLIKFYRDLNQHIRDGNLPDASALLAQANTLGIKPFDLIWGVMQPLLYHVGALWSQGELSVATEHHASSRVMTTIELLFENTPGVSKYRQSERPFAILTGAEGSYHTIGLRILEFGLASHGVATRVYLPGLPARELLALAEKYSPRFLGISVSLATQMRSVRETRSVLESFPAHRRPSIILGGAAFRLGLNPPVEWDFEIAPDLAVLSESWAAASQLLPSA